jgi:hypothetical protein
MNYIYKMFALLIAVSCSSVFAYKFTFINDTKDTINMRFQLAEETTWFEHTMAPGASAQEWFPWIHEKITDWDHNKRAGFCLEKMQIAQQVRTGSVTAGGNAIEAYGTEWKNIPVARACKNTSFTITKDKQQGQFLIIAK